MAGAAQEKTAYRTTMPFEGLSPLTDKTRRNVPWMGGGTLDQPRSDFDKNMGGDHKFINRAPDGTSHTVTNLFSGENDPKASLSSGGPELVVVDMAGQEHVFKGKNERTVRLEWDKPFRMMFWRNRLASAVAFLEKTAAGDFVPLVANLIAGCFKVESESLRFGKMEIGSCFAVCRGVFLTCAHVISKRGENPADVDVYVVESGRRHKAVALDVDYDMDLAVIKCETVRHRVLTPGSTEEIQSGSEVVCVGSPYGYDNNVTRGIVSSKGRKVPEAGGISYFFMDLAVYPGSSGGAVVSVDTGHVVGIAAIIVQSVGNYGLNAAIPIEAAKKRFQKHIQHEGNPR